MEPKTPVKILFFKTHMAWPRESGHDVHTYHMMRGLDRLGGRVSLVTARSSPDLATAGVSYDYLHSLDEASGEPAVDVSLTRLQERFRSYWGVRQHHLASFAGITSKLRPDAVVAVGLDALPFLAALRDTVRVWYAADEWVWHHASQFRLMQRRTWPELKAAVVKGLYERGYRSAIDRAWVVSDADAIAMRWLAGIRTVDVLPNGVDPDFYSPRDQPTRPETAVFWGRLDFGPNIQALQWFCQAVWPSVRASRPHATFLIIGFKPGPEVQRLAALPGVELRGSVPDIRPVVAECAVAVMPFVSGGGIKNKLLEAAAMGKPIVCTRRALTGLNGTPPVEVAGRASDWCRLLSLIWDDQQRRRELGYAVRDWVSSEHSWDSTAGKALQALTAAGAV